MAELAKVARQHDRLLSAGLDDEQRSALRELLGVMAERQGLLPEVHPGYRGART